MLLHIYNAAFILFFRFSLAISNYPIATWVESATQSSWVPRSVAGRHFKNEMYIVGGVCPVMYGNIRDEVFSADQNSLSSWNEILSSPSPWGSRSYHQIEITQDGFLYVMGGTFSSTNRMTNSVVKFNILGMPQIQNSYVTTAIPTPWIPRERHTTVVYKSRIVMCGGYVGGISATGYMNDVWALDLSTDSWQAMTMNAAWYPRFQTALVVHRGLLYLLGGNNQNDVYSTTDLVNWTCLTSHALWDPRNGHVVISFSGFLYLMGGFGGTRTGSFNDLWVSIIGDAWTIIEPSSSTFQIWNPRFVFGGIVTGSKIVVFGGIGNVDFYNDVWEYDFNGGMSPSLSNNLEVSALLDLFNSLNGIAWVNNDGWNANNVANICYSWHGISCYNGHVVSINLDNNNLVGFLNPSIVTLKKLISLEISGNYIVGNIFSSLNTLSSLIFLDFSGNFFSLLNNPLLTANCANVGVTCVFDNSTSINGNNYIASSELNALQLLYTSLNGQNWLHNTGWFSNAGDPCSSNWYGVICSFSGHITSIVLSNNNLVGTLPSNIDAFSQLYEIDLSFNNIQGDIPASLVSSSLLKVLNFESTNVDGALDQTIINYCCGFSSGNTYNFTGAPILQTNLKSLQCQPATTQPPPAPVNNITVYVVSSVWIIVILACSVTGYFRYRQYLSNLKDVIPVPTRRVSDIIAGHRPFAKSDKEEPSLVTAQEPETPKNSGRITPDNGSSPRFRKNSKHRKSTITTANIKKPLICMDEYCGAVLKKGKRFLCGDNHVVCRDCFRGWATHCIQEKLLPLKCPRKDYAEHCDIEVPERRIRRLLGNDLFAKYEATAISIGMDILPTITCPHCDVTFEVENVNLYDFFTCRNDECAHHFCCKCYRETMPSQHKQHNDRYHSNLDDRRKEVEELLTMSKVMLCPGCKTPGEKNEACTHMRCGMVIAGVKCDVKWCYVCGLKEAECDKANGETSIFYHNVDHNNNEKRCPMYLKDKGFGSGLLVIKGYPQGGEESLERFHMDRTRAFMQLYARVVGTDTLEALVSNYPSLLSDAWPEYIAGLRIPVPGSEVLRMMKLWGARSQEFKPNASAFPFKLIAPDEVNFENDEDNGLDDEDMGGFFSPLESPMGNAAGHRRNRSRSRSGGSFGGSFDFPESPINENNFERENSMQRPVLEFTRSDPTAEVLSNARRNSNLGNINIIPILQRPSISRNASNPLDNNNNLLRPSILEGANNIVNNNNNRRNSAEVTPIHRPSITRNTSNPYENANVRRPTVMLNRPVIEADAVDGVDNNNNSTTVRSDVILGTRRNSNNRQVVRPISNL